MLRINFKRAFFVCFFLAPVFCMAQITVYEDVNQKGANTKLALAQIFKGNDIPLSLNNKLMSFHLKKGYLATFAENNDGTGNSICYIASVSDIKMNFPAGLTKNISFIRCLPYTNVNKKGAGQTHNDYIAKLNASWFYDWHSNNTGNPAPEYVMMAKGENKADYESAAIAEFIAKPKATHLLAINEPDVKAAHPLTPPEDAVKMYRNLLQTGLRLGSPVAGQFGPDSTSWLKKFMALADDENLRVDFIALHWYDWIYWRQFKNPEPDVKEVFERFKAYVIHAHELYNRPIWVTEFNCNRNTTEQTHIEFMKLAIPWLDAQPFVERYAYFFPPKVQPEVDGKPTAAGLEYATYTSVPSLKKNVDEPHFKNNNGRLAIQKQM